MQIFIIEDDSIMAECIARAVSSYFLGSQPQVVNFTTPDQASPEISIFPDAIAALDAMGESCPDLILLDILLGGPNGFTLLNELASYSDTAKIPIIIVTSLDLPSSHFSHYNVKCILNKSTMTPATIQEAVRHAL